MCYTVHQPFTVNVIFGSVDNLLNGGLREGHLTELYGESASGKTQVLQLSLSWEGQHCTVAYAALAQAW